MDDLLPTLLHVTPPVCPPPPPRHLRRRRPCERLRAEGRKEGERDRVKGREKSERDLKKKKSLRLPTPLPAAAPPSSATAGGGGARCRRVCECQAEETISGQRGPRSHNWIKSLPGELELREPDSLDERRVVAGVMHLNREGGGGEGEFKISRLSRRWPRCP